MDPLQHLVAPRRPLPSPPSKARNGVSKNVFALPVIHQFEPVLASSPRSYVVANASKKQKENAESAPTGIEPPPVIPIQPQRPKSRETVESGRALRPQPPTGLASRTDVDIYRYSQATEQRMAIKPLFEQRRGSETRPASTKRKTKKAESIEGTSVELDDGRFTVSQSENEDKRVQLDGESESMHGKTNQEDRRTRSSAFEDSIGASIVDGEDLTKREVEDRETDVECLRTETAENSGDSLVKKLDISSCYEPFLQTKGPKLTWLREMVEASTAAKMLTIDQQPVIRAPKSDVLVYKTLSKDLRTFGGRNVLITVLLSSRGDAHITCHVEGEFDGKVVAINNSDLDTSKLLRRDLPVLTPKWADWIITRVCCDSRLNFYLDLTDAEGNEKRVIFSENIQINGTDIAVEMVALMTASSLLIYARETTSSTCSAEVLLRADDLRRLAISFDKWTSEGADQDVSTLFDDHDFLSQIAAKTNVIRLGLSCAEFVSDVEDSLRCRPVPSTDICIDTPASVNAMISVELRDSPNYIQDAFKDNNLVGTVALLVQAYVENGILSTLRHFQQREAIRLNVEAFMQQAATIDSEVAFNERVERNLEAARMSKLREIAIASIVDDMIFDFIVYECRVELHSAKYSGGYNDHYARKVQAAYRMSTQKRSYEHKRNVRMRAAQTLQALQRGIIARRRYSEMKVEREKYLFYGFRSSLYHATANMKDPRLRARELSTEAERRRHDFLMQVIQGYVTETVSDQEFRVSAQLVREIYNEYGVVVGCSTNFGDVVVSYLDKAPDQTLYARVGDSVHASDSSQKLFSNSQVSAALLLGLRDQYDDTFGLSSSARRVSSGGNQGPSQRALEVNSSAPPRWMLKTCSSFQQANLDRLAGLRLTRKAAGKKSTHLVARDYRCILSTSFDSFDKCRATWEADIRTRQEQQKVLDTFSVEDLAQHCLDLLISCVKDWGIDPDPLFEALNLCGRHCHGKAAIRVVEEKFNAYAARMNEVHGKKSVLTLREEVSQELEDFEKLLALRCLNMAVDDAITVPASELLHIMLKGNLDEEYIRHGLSTVLPIASISEKHELARKTLYAYANASYGEAFNLICWSCLDVAENVTVEAARFLDKITRPATDKDDTDNAMKTIHHSSESLAARALYLLAGSQAVRFLQFLAKVAHFNKVIQKRVLVLLAPDADKYEMHRLASALCSLEDFSIVSQIFDERFSSQAVRSCTSLWTQYATLFGDSKCCNAMNDIKEVDT
ncbi:hypothetical protein L916_00931 [Phytophthora nicotianae]|uniref:Uncharacterized protein n=1 Tax=Phytophthora nicotianae TaxID=4792 RepID=W2JTG5_PHYNI|nr:hypothetical protein L916_00931 [Phytophthora nicotianae]